MRIERLGELAHGCEAEAMLAAPEAGDRGMTRPHPLGQLLLRETELHALVDHQPRELLVGLLLFECGLVRGAGCPPLLFAPVAAARRDRARSAANAMARRRGRYHQGMAHATKLASSEAERRRAAAERLRGLFADVAPDRSLVDELIADRRAEARAEGGEGEANQRRRAGR
jgi:hypothetical protein